MSVGARILKYQHLRAYARLEKVYCQIIWDGSHVSLVTTGLQWAKNFKPVRSYTAIKTSFWVRKTAGNPQPPWLRYLIYTSPDGGPPIGPLLADVTLTLPTLSPTEWTKIEFEYDPVPLVAGVNYRDSLINAGNAGYPPYYSYGIQGITHDYADIDTCQPPGPGYYRWWYSPTNPGPWSHQEWWVVYQMIGY